MLIAAIEAVPAPKNGVADVVPIFSKQNKGKSEIDRDTTSDDGLNI